MNSTAKEIYGPFWKTWGFLLALTLVMIFVDVMRLPRFVLLAVLLTAMLTKAALIGIQFMDLRHERMVVGITVAVSLLLVGAILYGLIVPDGVAVLHGGR